MRRTLAPEEVRLWARVAETVRLAPGRAAPSPPPAPPPPTPSLAEPAVAAAIGPTPPPHRRPKVHLPPPPEDVEPGRKRRLVRERTVIDARLDLHGLDYDRARVALREFVARGRGLGHRHLLVITGKGYQGFGVLRQFAPAWLAEPGVREHVAGVSPAHPRHGGEGALYVALKAPKG